jgi:hypothetical protein
VATPAFLIHKERVVPRAHFQKIEKDLDFLGEQGIPPAPAERNFDSDRIQPAGDNLVHDAGLIGFDGRQANTVRLDVPIHYFQLQGPREESMMKVASLVSKRRHGPIPTQRIPLLDRKPVAVTAIAL